MPVSSSRPRTDGSAPGNGASYPNPGMRISDAERAEVADRLSKHYGDGRLDQAEFNERLDRAMRAKTQSDLHGLFADLPDAGPPGAPVPKRPASPQTDSRPRPRARARRRIPFLILVIVLSAVVGHALERPYVPYVPWLWIGLVTFFVLRYGPRLRHRR